MSQILLTWDKAGELKTAAPGIPFSPALRETDCSWLVQDSGKPKFGDTASPTEGE